MTEYGLFNDEGLMEGQFYSKGEAEKARTDRYHPDDKLTIDKICPEHSEQPDIGCEDCADGEQ